MAETYKLDKLLIEEKELNKQMAALDKEMGRIVDEKKKIARSISTVHTKIKRAQAGDILVSEHALIRYMERIKKMDLENIKKEILTDEIHDKIKKGSGYGTLNCGKYELVIKDYIIVSILDTEPKEGWGILLVNGTPLPINHYFKEDGESLCGSHTKNYNFKLERRTYKPGKDCIACSKILLKDTERIFKIKQIP